MAVLPPIQTSASAKGSRLVDSANENLQSILSRFARESFAIQNSIRDGGTTWAPAIRG